MDNIIKSIWISTYVLYIASIVDIDINWYNLYNIPIRFLGGCGHGEINPNFNQLYCLLVEGKPFIK